jgi:CBS domain-containing protein
MDVPLLWPSDTTIVKAGSLMILRRVKQLPVVDNGKLPGIVTLTDTLTTLQRKSSRCQRINQTRGHDAKDMSIKVKK